ncbi:PTS transporter subunit EIIB [Allocoprobacillus halotolerans]|uniref:PTS transporter subunit EIIB n=1 Tax=Allocoprobacillus halotolerans TaxID=2944914 RepID=A0ABY5I4C1_9FIRM|nr:PTS transporter subunit EIIB [Allocoprobacillus halotolerans]UTY39820.1 PTS transporter subunit EIIB [Allocoprobacillus halotolerans]
MDIEYIFIAIVIVVALVLLYLGFVHLIKNKRLNQEFQSTLPIQELLEALGGSQNLKEVRHTASKVTVVLGDQQLIDIDKIKSLGASGIVEGPTSLAMIFGKQSESIAADLKRFIA